jgi:hypothetical protein
MDTTQANIFCTQCGTENYADSSFCKNCGQPLRRYVQPPVVQPSPAPVQEPSREVSDRENLVQKRYPRYAKEFDRLENKGFDVTWNWMAFLCSPYWMFYRKMYLYGALWLAVQLASNVLNLWLINVLMLPFPILFGLYGDSMYLHQLDKKLKKAQTLSGEDKEKYLKRKGGTNLWLPLVLLGANLLKNLIVLYL